MKKARPVHLDLTKINMPLQAYTSILHRISGLFLAIVSILVIYALELSLDSERSFNQLKMYMQLTPIKLLLLTIFAALNYHLVAGIKHLVMDFGFAETKTSSRIAAILTILIATVLTIITGIWIW